jgi:hypothetical protein
MASLLDPIKAKVKAGMGEEPAVHASHENGKWYVVVNGWVDGVRFQTSTAGSTLEEACGKLTALLDEMTG